MFSSRGQKGQRVKLLLLCYCSWQPIVMSQREMEGVPTLENKDLTPSLVLFQQNFNFSKKLNLSFFFVFPREAVNGGLKYSLCSRNQENVLDSSPCQAALLESKLKLDLRQNVGPSGQMADVEAPAGVRCQDQQCEATSLSHCSNRLNSGYHQSVGNFNWTTKCY